jgi:hypothetical protein
MGTMKTKGGADMQKTDSQALELKKLTLTAWAHILYRKGMIDAAKLSRMTALIDKLKETVPGDSASDRA